MQKTKALLRIRKNLNQATADILCSSFILSTFNYCPLIWMFCGKQSNNLINSTHRRVLNARLDNFRLPFNDLLDETKSVNIHTKNLRLLLIEVYKSLNGLSPEFMRPRGGNSRRTSGISDGIYIPAGRMIFKNCKNVRRRNLRQKQTEQKSKYS